MSGPELGLGTARTGGGERAAIALLETAAQAGVALVDAAPGFSDMERTLGRAWPFPSPFRVVTKTVRLSEGLDRLEARARRSVERMGLPRAHALLVSAAEDLAGPEGRELWARLERLRGEGLFERIGLVAGAEDDPTALARRYRPDIVQLPVSFLDQRLVRSGVLAALADLGAEVQLRSIFLRGLLFMPRDALPPAAAAAGPRLSRIQRALAEARVDPMQAALSYVMARPEASAVVVGVSSAAELRAVLTAAAMPPADLDWTALALDDPAALYPSRWPSAA